ncbi:MAG: 30S ribosomal protein S16 [Candidatus Zambryskibacteria bacterium]|nr:30S ribosomal protein S16 [Candidatus Zambryskibacteria bacterium]
MLKMRLQRVGRTHEPAFRLVLTESKNSTKSGRFKEILGSYDPRKSTDSLNADRIKYWLSQGVTPTATVNNLLVTHQIISAPKINVSAKPARHGSAVGESGGSKKTSTAPSDKIQP